MQTLTGEDALEIDKALRGFGDIRCHVTDAYRAGLRAGMERAAKICEQEDSADDPNLPGACAAAIRDAIRTAESSDSSRRPPD